MQETFLFQLTSNTFYKGSIRLNYVPLFTHSLPLAENAALPRSSRSLSGPAEPSAAFPPNRRKFHVVTCTVCQDNAMHLYRTVLNSFGTFDFGPEEVKISSGGFYRLASQLSGALSRGFQWKLFTARNPERRASILERLVFSLSQRISSATVYTVAGWVTNVTAAF